MFVIYIEPSELNDATSHYVNIIKASLIASNFKFREVINTSSIQDDEIVIVITIKTFFLTWLKNRKQKIYIWFQGVLPEENLVSFHGIKKYFKFAYNRILENIALKYSEKIFFVSASMYKHYTNKYGYKENKHFIMPCFNQDLDESCFTDSKYNYPTFVYAGSLASWQCVEKTLELFSLIKKEIPSSKLTLLTAENDKAHELLHRYGIYDAEVKYVHYKNLNEELSKYKYGFLIREDIVVNNVATPTKMNSYMACGIIPIFSSVIGDFKEVFANIRYKVPVESDKETIDAIRTIENSSISADDVLNDYRTIFSKYYSSKYYISKISDFIRPNFEFL